MQLDEVDPGDLLAQSPPKPGGGCPICGSDVPCQHMGLEAATAIAPTGQAACEICGSDTHVTTEHPG